MTFLDLSHRLASQCFLKLSRQFLKYFCFVLVKTHKLTSLRSILSTASPLKPASFDYVYDSIKRDLLLGSITGEPRYTVYYSPLPVEGKLICLCWQITIIPTLLGSTDESVNRDQIFLAISSQNVIFGKTQGDVNCGKQFHVY